MHINGKRVAFGGLFLAITVVCMVLGSVIESNTLFLLAAASYLVGIVVRESGLRSGGAFFLAGVLLGFFTAPNKLYVLSYAAMGCYIWLIEFSWGKLAQMKGGTNRKVLFWLIKYLVFNIMYLPMLYMFRALLFPEGFSGVFLAGILLAGQAGLFLYDRAYEYVQAHLWNRLRVRIWTGNDRM